MQTLLLHLSDIHFKEKDNIINTRIDKIVEMFKLFQSSELEAIFLIVSGDIAYSGKKEEYEVAKNFFSDLRKKIRNLYFCEINFIIVPGNHDCEFSEDETRDILIKSLQGKENVNSISDSVIKNCIYVQNNFFNYCDSYKIPYKDKFFWQLISSKKNICFNCINTSWISTLKEKQGELLYPNDKLENNISESLLMISIFHHPYKWLRADNSNAFRKKVESLSDIILTGHEHESTNYIVSKNSGEINEYIEGGVLQENYNKENSWFNIILIDLENKKQKLYQFNWKKNEYSIFYEDKNWRELLRNKNSIKIEFENSSEYSVYINDIGANFTHRSKPKIYLNDLFVYPYLRERSSKSDKVKFWEGDKLINKLLDTNKILILGVEKVGKTTLGKKLYMDAQKNGLVPLFINSDQFREFNKEKIDEVIEKEFRKQYSQDLLIRYRLLNKDKKLLILDNFHSINLNINGKQDFLKKIGSIYDNIIIISNSIIQIEELKDKKDVENEFAKYMHLNLSMFGEYQISKIAKKWLLLGQEHIIEEEILVKNHKKILDNIHIVLGKNYLPAYPIFILTILQLIESQTQLNTQSGSYSYFYEYLIKDSFIRRNTKFDMDTSFTFLSLLSKNCFEKNIYEFDNNEINYVYGIYHSIYKTNFDLFDFIDYLLKNEIFEKVGVRYKFKYTYIEYYFYAKYLSDNLSKEETQTIINDLASNLHVEDNTNVLMFLTHLSKDPFVINSILSNAKLIYVDTMFCDFEKDVVFLNKLYDKLPRLALIDGDIEKNREEMLKEIDLMDAEMRDEDERNGETKSVHETNHLNGDAQIDESKEFNDILKLNVAFKNIQLLGQILKNFPGSIPGDTKFDITFECYNLNLRALNVVFKILEDNLESIMTEIEEYLKKKKYKEEENNRMIDRFKRFIFMMIEIISMSYIGSVADAVGSEKLDEIYKEIIEKHPRISFKLIDIKLKLNSLNFPEKEILNLAEELKNNYFALTLLKMLIIEHFRFYDVKLPVKQKVCDKLDIPIVKQLNS